MKDLPQNDHGNGRCQQKKNPGSEDDAFAGGIREIDDHFFLIRCDSIVVILCLEIDLHKLDHLVRQGTKLETSAPDTLTLPE